MSWLSRLFGRTPQASEPPLLEGEHRWRPGDLAECQYASPYWWTLAESLITGPRLGDRDAVAAVERIPAGFERYTASTQLLVFARFPDKKFLASEFTCSGRASGEVIPIADHLPRKSGFPASDAANPSPPKGHTP